MRMRFKETAMPTRFTAKRKSTGRKTAKRTTTKRPTSKVRAVDQEPVGDADTQRVPPRKIEMPRTDPPPVVEFDMDGSARWLKRMDPRRANFLCTIEWSWSPVHERMESYYLH